MALYYAYRPQETKSSLRLDEIPLRGTKSTLSVVEICGLRPQTMKPRNGAKTGLAGPVVRQDAQGLGGRLAKPLSGLPTLCGGEGPWGEPEAT